MECVKKDTVKKYGSRVKPGAETNITVLKFLRKFDLLQNLHKNNLKFPAIVLQVSYQHLMILKKNSMKKSYEIVCFRDRESFSENLCEFLHFLNLSIFAFPRNWKMYN
jgi:hypothetical protein